MLLFNEIILTCSLHMQEERTAVAIFHLLNGKRSIQTVHDAHIFQLEKFYGIYPQLTKQTWERKISELTRQRMLIPAGRNSYKLAGRTLENGNKHIIQRFQGLKYQETGPIFYKRLLLLIQTLTNSKMGYFTFIPVIDKTSITSWVKYAYKYIKQNEHQALS